MPTDSDSTADYPWPVGQALAHDLEQLAPCHGLRVIDLGCGRGHLGIAAIQNGARHVHFVDGNDQAIERMHALIVSNNWRDRAAARRHQWGEDLPEADLVLGGDILYRPECFAALMDSIASALPNAGRCWLSDPRRTLEDDLPVLAKARGLIWSSTRRERYTLVHITRAVR